MRGGREGRTLRVEGRGGGGEGEREGRRKK